MIAEPRAARHPAEESLQAYLDAELSTADAARIAEHCHTCRDCDRVLTELRLVQERLARDWPASTPAPVWPRIADRVRGDREGRLGPAFAMASAAACAAGIVLGILLGSGGSSTPVAPLDRTQVTMDELWQGRDGASLLDVYSSPQG